MSRSITFRIAADGKVHLEVHGVEDLSCEQISAAFEEALGTKVDVQYKPNIYHELDGIELYETDKEEE